MTDRPEWLAPDDYPSELVITVKCGVGEIVDRPYWSVAIPKRGFQNWRKRIRMARKRRRGWA